jgi:hypothetical protein
MRQMIRIANAQAFWGDDDGAAAQLIEQQPDIDYLTLDYLAEVSMSIMARQRQRDPAAGYARDFLRVIRSVAPHWKAGRAVRIVTNAGGLDPMACARACAAVLAESGLPGKKIAAVTGDDVMPMLDHLTGPLDDVRDRLVTASAYLGADAIVEALSRGADLVITGRAADPSLVVGPCIHEFGWSAGDFGRLAGATVAGHLIECGTQVSGGICTDWLTIPDAAHIGFPIVEIAPDGACTVTKPAGTGGRVNEQTVKEQLLYELGDPGHYLSPDCTVSFLTLDVREMGGDRVRVAGATGGPPPPTYKVSATYRAGFRAAGTLTILGREAQAKARRCGQVIHQKLREAGCAPQRFLAEPIGGDDQVTLRLAVADERREVCERFSSLLVPLVTAGPQGTTGYFEGRPKVREVFGYRSLLIDRQWVAPAVEVVTS